MMNSVYKRICRRRDNEYPEEGTRCFRYAKMNPAFRLRQIRSYKIMLGNFVYSNPTKLYFGENSIKYLARELPKYGPNVVIAYGGGSIKKNGIYDAVTEILRENNKNIAEIPGVMPNPTIDKLYEGIKIAREHKADLILAIGGGSVCDYSKALSISVNCDEDPWEKYYVKFNEPDKELDIVPVGCILTMVGTGSEMNAGAVITKTQTKQKIGHVFRDERVMPKFSILNPRFTMTLPHYQMVSGIYDIFSHICEQYFSGEDDNTSDYISEGLMRSVIHSSRIANKDMQDYDARSNIMWTATWALNTLIAKGKRTDWMVHMLGQAIGGYINVTHGMTLSAVSLPYYRYILPFGLMKFKRFAVNVWNVDPTGKTDEQVAIEGLSEMEKWMKELGLVMNISELGIKEEMLEEVTDVTIILLGGYKKLTREEIISIFKECL